MSQQRTAWQATFLLAVLVVIFGGGSMALAIMGRDVPTWLTTIDGGMATSVIAHIGFFNLRGQATDSLSHMSNAVAAVTTMGQAGISAATVTTATNQADGKPHVEGP